MNEVYFSISLSKRNYKKCKPLKFKIRQLEAFRAVADSGSITKAARYLGISQPAVSRLVSDFSKTVGFDLFQRRRGILEPTSHLPSVLVSFLRSRPGVTVSLEPDRPERILEWIIGEQYDCGLTDGFSGHPATISQDLDIKSVCILPTGHPLEKNEYITPSDLSKERLIHARRDSWFFQELARSFGADNVEINSFVEVRQFTTACTMVNEGIGASIVSALDAEAFRETGIIIKPFKPAIFHRLSIIQPASGPSSPVVLDFIDNFIESLQPFLANSVEAS